MDSTSNSSKSKKFIQDFLEISCLFTLRDAVYPKNMQQIQSAKIHLYSHLLVAVLRINKRKMHDVGFIPAYRRISSFITSFSPSEAVPSLLPSSSLPLYSPLPSFTSPTGSRITRRPPWPYRLCDLLRVSSVAHPLPRLAKRKPQLRT